MDCCGVRKQCSVFRTAILLSFTVSVKILKTFSSRVSKVKQHRWERHILKKCANKLLSEKN